MSASPTRQSWKSMIQRCTNSNNAKWKYYGGRGIVVCDRWLGKDVWGEHRPDNLAPRRVGGFEAFLADMGERPGGTTLDRIDNDGNYEPGNCRWATWSEQRTNRPGSRSDTAVTHKTRDGAQ